MEGLFSSNNPFKRKRPEAGEALEQQNQQEEKQQEEQQQEQQQEKPRRPLKRAKNREVPSAEPQPDDTGIEELLQRGATDNVELLQPDATDNEEKLRRTIFVGNLPIQTKRKALIREFAIYGSVESARLRSIPVGTLNLPRKAAVTTGQTSETRSSINAYVVFKEEESAEAALAHNMKLVGDKHIRVDRALAPRKPGESLKSATTYDKDRTVFLGNVPFDAEEEELYALFAVDDPQLALEAVRVVRDQRTNVGKGFAFLLFRSPAGVQQALSRKGELQLRERSLRARRVVATAAMKQARGDTGDRRSGGSKKTSYEGTRAGSKQRKSAVADVKRGTNSRPQKKPAREAGKKRPAVAARKQMQKKAKQDH